MREEEIGKPEGRLTSRRIVMGANYDRYIGSYRCSHGFQASRSAIGSPRRLIHLRTPDGPTAQPWTSVITNDNV